MKAFKADLHLHTCLSPCGDLDMSPVNIVEEAKRKNLDMIGITDHNSTRNVKTVMEVAEKYNIFVLGGCEVTSQEEVHCLAFFPDINSLDEFQVYLDAHLPDIENKPEKFGFQVAVDKFDTINYEENRLLVAALNEDIESIAEKVLRLGGVFIPAHVDKEKNSVFSQLGFLPYGLSFHALELSPNTCLSTFNNIRPGLAFHCFVQNSDAHYLNDIGKTHTIYNMQRPDWDNFYACFQKDSPNNIQLL
ncbi:MAG: PHP domain-containing protein [Bacteroidales bacterium]